MKKSLLRLFQIVIVTGATLVSLSGCEDTDSYIADKLRNCDWQGYIGAYYSDRWGLTGDEYATVMRFTSKESWYTSGRGEELDYSTRYRGDYAYCTFKWFIVDGDITLIYDDAKWNPIYITDYRLNNSRFSGYIYDGSNRRIQFDLENITYNDWGYYNHSRGSYGGFSNQRYYNSRETGLLDEFDDNSDGNFGTLDTPLVIDRTEQVRLESGEPDAVSIVSGVFAEKMKQKER